MVLSYIHYTRLFASYRVRGNIVCLLIYDIDNRIIGCLPSFKLVFVFSPFVLLSLDASFNGFLIHSSFLSIVIHFYVRSYNLLQTHSRKLSLIPKIGINSHCLIYLYRIIVCWLSQINAWFKCTYLWIRPRLCADPQLSSHKPTLSILSI